MIPKCNNDGYLPKGIYKATLKQIEKRFGRSNKRRKKLFQNLRALVNLSRKHKKGIERFLLNGSFVTSKKLPDDLDCILIFNDCFDMNSPDIEKLYHAKKLFNAHLFIFMKENAEQYKKLIAFFGYDRERKPKGYLEVVL